MKSKIALYGNTALERAYCKDCETYSIIKKGRFSCCDAEEKTTPSSFERISLPFQGRKTPTLNEKNKILQEQDYACLYCSQSFEKIRYRNGIPFVLKLAWDHKLPFSLCQNNNSHNFVAACSVCNSLKSDKVFQTVEEVQVYLKDKRRSKGYDF